jgi:hypothetical protein
MNGLTEWTRDLLMSRGALLEADADTAALRALLPPETAAALRCGEWLSLNFETTAGADDSGEWLDRLETLLPARCPVIAARLRDRAPVIGFDAAGVLDRELIVQNGVHRLVEDYSTLAQYFLCTFQYAIESDERSIGFFTVGVNAGALSLAPQPQSLLRTLQERVEDDPAFELPCEPLRKIAPLAERAARREARGMITVFEQAANRRLARDRSRVDAYYGGLLSQIQKRVTRKSTDPAAIAKERSRAEATELDRLAKLEDLRRKYSLRVQLSFCDVIAIQLPVREISVRLIRKKEQRTRVMHWNSIVRRLEAAMCEKCSGPAHPMYLCDDKVHVLCRECMAQCPACGRTFCRVCQPRCKCEKDPSGRQ